MTTPTTPVRQPGDPIPPPPEPRYPWRVGVTMLGLVALVLVVVWLGFQAVKGPATTGEFPSPATATAIAQSFQATVAAADTAQPRPTRQPTPQPTPQAAGAPTSAAASTRAPTALSAPVAAPRPTPQIATTVPAAATNQPATPQPASATSAPTPSAAAASVAEPARTAAVEPAGDAASVTETPVPTVPPDIEQAVSAAYNQYWQVKSDALFALDATPLSQVAAGPELTRLQQRIADDQAAGRATLVKTEHSFVVLSADDNHAQVADDYHDLSVWVDPSTHEPLPGQSEPTSTETAPEHKVVVDLERSDGTWKVVDGAELVAGGTAP